MSKLCQQPGHSQKEILGVCVEPNCQNVPTACLICIQKGHGSHANNVVYFDQLNEKIQLLFKDLQLTSIKEQLNLIKQKSISSISEAQLYIENLERISLNQWQINSSYLQDVVLLIKQSNQIFPLLEELKNIIPQISLSYDKITQMLKKNEQYRSTSSMTYQQPPMANLQEPSQKQNELPQPRSQQLLPRENLTQKAVIFGQQESCQEKQSYRSIGQKPSAEDLYIQAYELLAQKQYEDAYSHIERALELSQSATALVTKGKILMELGRYQDAYNAYKQAQEMENNMQEAQIGKERAQKMLNSQQGPQRSSEQAKTIESDNKYTDSFYEQKSSQQRQVLQPKIPSEAKSAYDKGFSLLQNESYEKAISNFTQAIRIYPDHAEAYCLMGGIANYKLRKFEKALECLDKSINIQDKQISQIFQAANQFENQNKPSFDEFKNITDSKKQCLIQAYTFKVVIFIQGQNYELALSDVQEGLKRDASNITLKYYQLKALQGLGKQKEALALIEELILMEPNQLNFVMEKATIQTNLGEYSQAIQSFDIILNFEPNNQDALESKAGCLVKMRRNQEALAVITACIKANPNQEKFYFRKCSILNDSGSYQQSLTEIDKALQIFPQNIKLMLLKGKTLEIIKNFDMALEVYNKILTIDPKNKDTKYHKALTLSQMNQNQKAIQIWDELIQADPPNPQFRLKKANLLNDEGRYQEAIEEYDWAIALDPSDPLSHFYKGQTMANMKKYQEANSEYEEALRINPQFKEAQQMKTNIQQILRQSS